MLTETPIAIGRRSALLPGNVRRPDMSVSSTETILRNAKMQISQRDINDSLMKALAELTKEVKRLEDEVRRARREAQMGRRVS
jgi:uncharacterized protein YlxW (UPF0749 family)